MIIPFLIFGILPLSTLTGYMLFLAGFQINEIAIIVGIEFLAFLVLPLLFDGLKTKKSLITILIIAIFFAICLVSYKTFYKNQERNKEEKVETRFTAIENNFTTFEEKILELKIQIETPTKNIYSETIPVPQNFEEAFKQHTEADYEFRNENYDVARKIYKNILDNYPASEQLKSILQNSIGATYSGNNDFENALIWYNKAKIYKNHNINVNENIAIIYYKQGNLDSAIKEYELILSSFPKETSTYNKLGVLYSLNGEFDKAIQYFNDSILKNYIVKGLYFNIAQCYLRKGPEFDGKAIEYLEKEINLYPDNAEAKFQLGAAYGWQQNFEKGIPLIEEAIILNNKLIYDLPKFGLPHADNLPSLDDFAIIEIKIFPDEIAYKTIKKQK
jgi:tetratricopeptide (TPR) repeat protein